MTWLREIDRWLIDSVLPAAAHYRALAVRMVGPADADDLVQEAYARLLMSSNWRSITNPPGFTLQIVRNLALDRIRRASVVSIVQVAAADLIAIDESPNAHAIIAARQELACVVQMVDRLPPQCRKVVRMRKFDGLSPQQIAESLGLSVSTVEKHLAKGVAIVAEELAKGLALPQEEYRPTPWKRQTDQR